MLVQLNDCIGGLLHLGPNVITFRALLHLGPNVITFRTLLHLGQLLHLGLQQTLFRLRKQSVFFHLSLLSIKKLDSINEAIEALSNRLDWQDKQIGEDLVNLNVTNTSQRTTVLEMQGLYI